MSQAAADVLVNEAYGLFRAERYGEAALVFQRAVAVFPPHALGWKGLGHSLLCMHKVTEAARAFDQAIGLRPESATALWGGALAHAELGNNVMAQNYLRRTLVLQPTWFSMAMTVPQLVPLLQISTRAADLLKVAFGPFSSTPYKHATDSSRTIDIGRIANLPSFGRWTFVTVGMSNHVWQDKPRVELVMASMVDGDLCGKILANLAFHLTSTGFFPEAGTVVRDVVAALAAGDLSRQLPHIYVQTPTSWQIEVPLDPGPPAITLAQVFPISDAEYRRWREIGAERFGRSLVERQVDVADFRRTAAT